MLNSLSGAGLSFSITQRDLMQKWRKFHLQELKIAVNNSCCTPRANAMRNDPVHLTVISAAAAALLLFPRFCNQTLFDMCFLLVEYVLYTLYTSAVIVVEFLSISCGIQ